MSMKKKILKNRIGLSKIKRWSIIVLPILFLSSFSLNAYAFEGVSSKDVPIYTDIIDSSYEVSEETTVRSGSPKTSDRTDAGAFTFITLAGLGIIYITMGNKEENV